MESGVASSRARRAVVVGGTGGLGLPIARRLHERGEEVLLTSRDGDRAEEAAGRLGSGARGLALDLSRPETVAEALAGAGRFDHLVLTSIEQTALTLDEFDIPVAASAVTTKLVGYLEVVRVLRPELTEDASIVLFGGLAKDRPYPGSTMVTIHNHGISGMVKTLALQVAPHRVNALHPGVVGDSPRWAGVDHPHRDLSPIGRFVTVAEVVSATEFLLDNTGINGQDLHLDGGLMLR